MNETRARRAFGTGLPLAVFFVCSLSGAQAPLKTRIRDCGDVLPPAVVKRLEGRNLQSLLKPNQDQQVPIFVLVNPALLDGGRGGDLKALIRSWKGKGGGFPEALVKGLVEKEGNTPAIHSCLVKIGTDFFELFFGSNVLWNLSLTDLITKQYFKGEVVIVGCFDVTCRPEGDRFLADLTLKIFRVEVDRARPNPQPIKSMEMLFQDRARGRAPLPPASSGESRVRDAYRAAVIDALDGKIALSLWHNARMGETSWVSGKRKRIVAPSLTRTAAGAGKGGVK